MSVGKRYCTSDASIISIVFRPNDTRNTKEESFLSAPPGQFPRFDIARIDRPIESILTDSASIRSNLFSSSLLVPRSHQTSTHIGTSAFLFTRTRWEESIVSVLSTSITRSFILLELDRLFWIRSLSLVSRLWLINKDLLV